MSYTVLVYPSSDPMVSDLANIQLAIDYCADRQTPIPGPNAPFVVPRDGGAAGTGAVARTGGVVLLAEGVFRLSAQLVLKSGVSLEGMGLYDASRPADQRLAVEIAAAKGSWLFIDHGALTQPPPAQRRSALVVQSGTTVRRLSFYYPQQAATISDPAAQDPSVMGPGPTLRSVAEINDGLPALMPPFTQGATPQVAAPLPFPATIQVAAGATNVLIEECLFRNSYVGIDALQAHDNLNVVDCCGAILYAGLRIANGTGADRISRVHWNFNFWGSSGDALEPFIKEFGVGFYVAGGSATTLTDCMSIFFRRPFWLRSATGVTLRNCQADVPQEPFVVEGGSRLRLLGCNTIQGEASDPGGDIADPTLTARAEVWLTPDAAGLAPTDVIIEGCTFAASGVNGIRISAGRNIVIAGSTIAPPGLRRTLGNYRRFVPYSCVLIEAGANIRISSCAIQANRGTYAVSILGGNGIQIIANKLSNALESESPYTSDRAVLRWGAAVGRVMIALNQVSVPVSPYNWFGTPPAGGPEVVFRGNQYEEGA